MSSARWPEVTGSLADRAEQEFFHPVLGHECNRTGASGTLARGAIIIEAQDDYRAPRTYMPEFGRGRDPIHSGHGNIHQDDIGAQRWNELNGLFAGARFANHPDIRFERQTLPQNAPCRRLIVDEKQRDHGHPFAE